jgi:D-3-phosphoglycerate dehydrogenase
MSNNHEVRRWDKPFEKAIILENPDPSLDDHLRELGIEPVRIPTSPDEEELIELLEKDSYQLLYKRSRVPVTERVLDAGKDLAAIMLCCIGDDSVDKQACAERGVLVTNDPVSNARSVCELAFGEILCLSRRVFHAVQETNKNDFAKSAERRYEIKGKTLGIFGLGNIGSQVAKMGEMLGMEPIFFDSRPAAREVGMLMGWRSMSSLDELFTEADIVTAHVSAFDYKGNENTNVIRYEDFKAMSDKDYDSPRIFLNLARGNIHSSEALLQAVEEGHVRQAMVDVFPDEPRNREDDWDNPYADNPNIFATPHVGAATQEAQPRIARHVANTTELLSNYGTLRNCVMAPKHVVGFEPGQYEHILTVVHSSERGTKKAIDECIYDAGASNVVSAHRDFDDYGIAYEVIALDRKLPDEAIQEMIEKASEVSNSDFAIRAVRQLTSN